MIFHRDADFDAKMTPEQLQAVTTPWMDWMGGLAAQDKLANPGNRLNPDGKVVKPEGIITNGPYVEIKELIGGYSIISADSLEEATEISKGCPILRVGGNVEVRQIVPMNM